MKFQLWTVGKVHESYVQEGIQNFTKRINHYYPAQWTILPVPKNAGTLKPHELKEKEGESILALIKKEDYLVVLDERGKTHTSETLAQFIQQRANESEKNIIFLIGGAFGVSQAVLARANFTWSLSSLVFPHQLVRLILAEQLYRACTILRNESYHHV